MTLKHTLRVCLFILIFTVFALTLHTQRTAGESEEFTVTAGPQIPIKVEEPEPLMSNEDMSLIALVTMAEAEGESEMGKRLVIDTILNRVDNPRWPDTVQKVIYQQGQFSCMWNGRADRCYVRDDILQLVKEELIERTNTRCIFFRTGRYPSDGTPLFQEGNHYFSGY